VRGRTPREGVAQERPGAAPERHSAERVPAPTGSPARRAFPGANVLRRVLDIALPPRCLSCAAPVTTHGGVCGTCLSGLYFITGDVHPVTGLPDMLALPRMDEAQTLIEGDEASGLADWPEIAAPPAYARARAAVFYSGTGVSFVSRLKFGDRGELVPFMARHMARVGASLLRHADLLVPVPLHRRRLHQRRFNQSALLAHAIGAASGVPVEAMALVRTRHTRPQVGLSHDARIDNVADAFALRDAGGSGADWTGLTVVLVDDVETTGATLNACALALLGAGAAEVHALTFAKVMRPGLAQSAKTNHIRSRPTETGDQDSEGRNG